MDHFSCNDQLTASRRPMPSTGAGKDEVKYKGVRLRKWGKWVSEIRLPNSRERIWLGSYDSAEKAARAFDAAQFCLRGRAGKFNFEESARIGVHLVGGRTGMLTPAEIQDIASQYGNSFSAEVHPPQETQEEFNSAICSATLEPNPTTITTATFPVSSEAGGAFGMDWPSSSNYYDNILVPNPNNNLPDYGLMMSSLDHMHEDMYMAPHFDHGTISAPDQEEQNVDDQNYSQHSFLWNF